MPTKPCNCGGSRSQEDLVTPRQSALQPDTEVGLYALALAPDCTQRYEGAYRRADVWIVARGTEFERLFRRADRVQANTLARRNNWTLDHVRADQLCHESVVELLGA